MKALYFNEFGDSSVLQYGEVAEPQINENEVLI
ncbi:alcohol dehydrogenase, partial [Tetragenococcus halophilus]|nr:alcohol dehydrogenase [Tetragenococcus halophilus]